MFEKPRRHDVVEPQLAAMVDVFSILIIFLIAGTVMGTTAVVLPAGLVPPRSISKESMLTAPQLTIDQTQVRLTFSQSSYPVAAFLSDSPNDMLERFKADVKNYMQLHAGKPDVDAINFVADQSLTYDKVFAVIKAAREAGMKSILFVATSDFAHE